MFTRFLLLPAMLFLLGPATTAWAQIPFLPLPKLQPPNTPRVEAEKKKQSRAQTPTRAKSLAAPQQPPAGVASQPPPPAAKPKVRAEDILRLIPGLMPPPSDHHGRQEDDHSDPHHDHHYDDHSRRYHDSSRYEDYSRRYRDSGPAEGYGTRSQPAAPEMPPVPGEDELARLSNEQLRQLIQHATESLEQDLDGLGTGAGWKGHLATEELRRLSQADELPPADRERLRAIAERFARTAQTPKYRSITGLWGFQTLRTALPKYAATPEERQREQLARNTEALRRSLDRLRTGPGWKKHLELDELQSLTRGGNQLQPADRDKLRDVLERLDQTSQDSRYASVARLEGFDALRRSLAEYLATVPERNLPEPPVDAVGLNPQPEPPGGTVRLNPQPEPPGGAVRLNPQPEPPGGAVRLSPQSEPPTVTLRPNLSDAVSGAPPGPTEVNLNVRAGSIPRWPQPGGALLYRQSGEFQDTRNLEIDPQSPSQAVTFSWDVSKSPHAGGALWQVSRLGYLPFDGGAKTDLEPSGLVESGKGDGKHGSFAVDFKKHRGALPPGDQPFSVRILPIASAVKPGIVGQPSNVIGVYYGNMPAQPPAPLDSVRSVAP